MTSRRDELGLDVAQLATLCCTRARSTRTVRTATGVRAPRQAAGPSADGPGDPGDPGVRECQTLTVSVHIHRLARMAPIRSHDAVAAAGDVSLAPVL
jgi:hypothetical protein